jgi:GT2 family glycosyltransferase
MTHSSPEPLVAVVVPTSGHRDSMGRLLEGMTRQTLPPESFEVLVVLDGATDGTAEFVKNFWCSFRLVAVTQARRGRAAACNAGIRRAASPLVLILDDDMEPDNKLLEAHLAAHATAPPRAVMGAVPVALGSASRPLERWVAHRFAEHHDRLRDNARFHLRDFYSGNTSIPRAGLIEVGGFDEHFAEYGHEDLELFVRLRRAGLGVAFEPDAVAHQTYAKTFADFAADMRAAGRTAVQLSRKHPEVAAEVIEFRGGPKAWTVSRDLWLRASRHTERAPASITGLAAALERTIPRRLTLFYQLAADFFFWLGVQDASAIGRSVFER